MVHPHELVKEGLLWLYPISPPSSQGSRGLHCQGRKHTECVSGDVLQIPVPPFPFPSQMLCQSQKQLECFQIKSSPHLIKALL